MSEPKKQDDTRGTGGGDRRTQRASHKLPKTRGVRLLLPLPESANDALRNRVFRPQPEADTDRRLSATTCRRQLWKRPVLQARDAVQVFEA
jgi:hypothetical protein